MTLESVKAAPESVQDSLYYELFRINRTSSPAQALEYSLEGLRLSKTHEHPSREVKFYNALGWLYQSTGKYELSEEYYLNGVALAKKWTYTERLMFFYNNLGVLYEGQSRFDGALDYYFQSLEIARKLTSYKDQVITLNNIGLIYYRLGEYQQGTDYLSQGIAIAIKHDIPSELVYSYTNRGLCLTELKNYTEAYTNFREALNLCEKGQSCDAASLSDIYYGLGMCEFINNRIGEATQHFKLGLPYALETGNKVSLSLYYFYEARIELKNNSFQSALDALKKSDAYAKEVKSKLRIVNNYELYSQIYEKMGEIQLALDYSKRYVQANDSLFSTELKENINRIQIHEAQKEKQAIIEEQQKIITQSRYILYLITAVCLLAFAIVVLLYKLNRVNKKSRTELEEVVNRRTIELKHTNRKLRKANKEYSDFLYRSYHDLKGPLATMSGLIQLAGMETERSQILSHLQLIQETGAKLNSKLSMLLRVNELKGQTLTYTRIFLSDLIQGIHLELHGQYPQVNVTLPPAEGNQVPIQSDLSMVTIVISEVMRNAYHFSHARDPQVEISYSLSKYQQLEVSIRNNGHGIPSEFKERIFDIFTVANENHGLGMGLYLARVAAERIGANIVLRQAESPVLFTLYFPAESPVFSPS